MPHADVRVGRLNVCNDVHMTSADSTRSSQLPSQRDIADPADRVRNLQNELGRLRAPIERRAVDPDAVEDHRDLPRDGDLRLFHSDPFCKLHSPGFEGGPFFGPIKQNGRGFEQISPE